MKSITLIAAILTTSCTYSPKDSRSYNYQNYVTQSKREEQPPASTPAPQVYTIQPAATYVVNPPNYVVEYNGRVESHTPVIYTPPRAQERVYGIRAYYGY